MKKCDQKRWKRFDYVLNWIFNADAFLRGPEEAKGKITAFIHVYRLQQMKKKTITVAKHIEKGHMEFNAVFTDFCYKMKKM